MRLLIDLDAFEKDVLAIGHDLRACPKVVPGRVRDRQLESLTSLTDLAAIFGLDRDPGNGGGHPPRDPPGDRHDREPGDDPLITQSALLAVLRRLAEMTTSAIADSTGRALDAMRTGFETNIAVNRLFTERFGQVDARIAALETEIAKLREHRS
jgi:hypothetical protein